MTLGQDGSSMYPGRTGPVDSKGGRQRGKGGECWWSNKQIGRCSHLEGDLAWALRGQLGKGLFQKIPTGEALTRIPPPSDGTSPPAVTVGKDT